MKKAKKSELRQRGIFTPWSECLCETCHDAVRPLPHIGLVAKGEDDSAGYCTRCDAPVWARYDVGVLTRLRKLLPGSELWQTGGMCVALALSHADGGHVVMTVEESVMVGVYGKGGWDENEQAAVYVGIPAAMTDKRTANAIRKLAAMPVPDADGLWIKSGYTPAAVARAVKAAKRQG